MEGESALRITELRNVKIGAEALENGQYRLMFTDSQTHEVIWVGFRQDVADSLVEQLTGGIRVVSRIPK